VHRSLHDHEKRRGMKIPAPLDRNGHLSHLTIWFINQSVYHDMQADTLSVTFAALADPTRRAILSRLAAGECTVTELAKPFEMSLPAVSKHLRVLERAGLISRGKEAQWRPCRIEAAPLEGVAEWAEGFRELWEARLDRLENYLQGLQKKEKKNARKRHRE
jgi:DNA-binding transcriptional ArsR family regulator